MNQTFISLLRGINVSGHNIMKMADLHKLYEDLGFTRIKTYLQSGNVVFQSSENDAGKLEQKIKHQIAEKFAFDVPVIVLSKEELAAIVNSNPFGEHNATDKNSVYVTILAQPPGDVDENAILEKKKADEEIRFLEKAVFLYCPGGYGNTKLSNQFLEKKFKVLATTRNWKTTNELMKLADAIGD